MSDDRLVLLQACTDHIAADVLAGLLRSESIPAVVYNRAPVPGLEQGADVLVPSSWLARARRLLAQQLPTDAELAELAIGTSPDPPPEEAG